MGCDIYLFVERRQNKSIPSVFVDTDNEKKIIRIEIPKNVGWCPCRISFFREWSCDKDYEMFAKLANVNNYGNLKHIPLRGFPNDASNNVINHYAFKVLSDEEFQKRFPNEGDGLHTSDSTDDYYEGQYISESKALHYIKELGAVEMIGGGYIKNRYLIDSDFHHANWCTLSELEECVNEVFFDKELKEYLDWSEEWVALVHYMKGLELAGHETRCIFWFEDNIED